MDIETIYNTLMDYCLPESAAEIENAFSDGSICDRLYAQVYEAKLRINQRLGTQEDSDVELIIGNLLEIARIVSYKMYRYGDNTGIQLNNTATQENS